MSKIEPSLMKYLERRNVTMKDMIDAALEMFVPHPGVEDRDKAAKILKEELEDALSDVDVSCLVVACCRAEDDAYAGLIPNLSRDRFMGRPGLIADELLGITIAQYIAGARGMFEFVRFDMKKPGVLARLGPIMNDGIGGLIAGCSSNMYTRATRESKKG